MDRHITLPDALDGRRRTTTLALVCAAGLAATGKLASAAEKSATHKVIMKATSYAPLALTVKRGDTVVWVNEDPFPHTVTAAGAFDSKSIAAGASWTYKARKAGEFAYTCTFHPNMKGTLKVE
ncbi:MAG: cupredoxin domain-containing protein [Burkholderiaceae bacterium]